MLIKILAINGNNNNSCNNSYAQARVKVDAVPGRLNQLRVEMKTSQFKIAEFALCLRIVFFGFNFFSMVTRCKTLFIRLREFYSY